MSWTKPFLGRQRLFDETPRYAVGRRQVCHSMLWHLRLRVLSR